MKILETRAGGRSPLLRPSTIVLALTMLLWMGNTSFAQESARPDRGGFTLLLDLGVGFQADSGIDDSAVGFGGLNLGIGGFLTEDLALMFRASGTNVDYGSGRVSLWQVSGVGGIAVQYWPHDRFNVLGGVGVGFWDLEGINDQGFGLILGAGYAFFNRGKHSLQIRAEYSPAFTDPGAVHNIGILFGYQLL